MHAQSLSDSSAVPRNAAGHRRFRPREGEDVAAYALPLNLRRRSPAKGQAMGITVKVRFFGEQLGDGVAVMGRESTVLQRAPDLVGPGPTEAINRTSTP